jgi:3-deoxy-D-manno-octulosonic-acid transferase
MRFFYFLSILIYPIVILIASPFNKKAKQWITGRKNWRKNLRDKINPSDKIVWIHCASLGEFEQGRPLIEKLKEKAPEYKILLTFFSPSGYELRKEWPVADHILYLPSDTRVNAFQFLEIVKPAMVIFVKYEFWYNFILETSKRNIPLYLVSGIFRADQHFFKWYGGFFRKMLNRFTHFFVQDDNSEFLLKNIGIKNITVSGDTRIDRVFEIAREAKKIDVLEKFRSGEKLFLAGSSWKKDEEMITAFINSDPERMKWIFAPHEVTESNIVRLEKLIKTSTVRYSAFSEGSESARVMIIDNIGILASAYRYAYVASIGGGFGKGIHNILEPACWGVPVLFGPDYKDFKEAVELIEEKGAYCFNNFSEFTQILNKLLINKDVYETSSHIVSQYIQKNSGATEKILFGILGERY